jgi:choice-of-anchor C domain-containing protein
MSVSIERSGIVLAALAAIFGGLVAVVVAQPLATNRGFEAGPDPGEAMALSPGSKALDGWTVADADVSYVGRKWQHGEGSRSVALLCGGAITQTITTEPEQTYEVRFVMAGDPDASPSLKTVAVSLGEDTRMFTFDTAGRSRKDMGWASRTWVFKVKERTSTLTFRSPKAQCSVPAVDNVRVEPISICVQIHPAGAGCGAAGNPIRPLAWQVPLHPKGGAGQSGLVFRRSFFSAAPRALPGEWGG